ncbi:MAG: MFS transporter [Nanoarchaeota archaeon]|nr:MFS transporter [Nanoarchaeota archaeon]
MKDKYESNIWKYYLYEFFMNLWFILPISVIFLREMGIKYGQIGLLEFTVSFSVILFEIPTGVFSDFIGKKIALFFGSLFWTIAMVMIGLSSTFPLFLIGFLVWGLADSLMSGTKSAMVYDTLKALKRKKSYLSVRGKSRLIIAVSTIIASLSGTLLYEIDSRLPWVFFGVSAFIASFFILSCKEPYKKNSGYTMSNQIGHIKESMNFVFSQRTIRWIVFYSALIILPFTIFNNIIKQPYIISIGFQVISLGWIIAFIYGISGIFSMFSERIEKHLGEKGSFIVISLVHGLGFMMLGLYNIMPMLALISLIFLSRAYKDNVIEFYINNHTSSDKRSTVLSIQNLVVNVTGAVYVLVGGVLLDILKMNHVLIGMGVITLILSIGYIMFGYPKAHASG